MTQMEFTHSKPLSTLQGQALDQHAKKSVRVLVVGNPANTNALICAKYAPSIPRENFSAMTRLDQNRAQVCVKEDRGCEFLIFVLPSFLLFFCYFS